VAIIGSRGRLRIALILQSTTWQASCDDNVVLSEVGSSAVHKIYTFLLMLIDPA